jgi:hypothetical protein
MTKEETNTTYFTRLRGLATVVWNPAKDRALAHFSRQGLLATDNPQVISTLHAMGYREVTAEQIVAAGLPVPGVDDTPDEPGRGYQPGELGLQPGTAMAGQPERNGADASHLFEPDPMLPAPPGDAGRKLVK